MTLTLGNWIFIGILIVIGIISVIVVCLESYENKKKHGVVAGVISLAVIIGTMVGLNWYNTSTASGMRNYKDFQSEMANGINRELVITAEDGREIFRYKGKFDLDMDNEGNYLRFETQEGKRYTIEYGIQDTVLVVED